VALLIIVLLVTLAAAGARLYARRRPRGDDAA
jgi:hypothetical protein